jgi:hypothetical protein
MFREHNEAVHSLQNAGLKGNFCSMIFSFLVAPETSRKDYKLSVTMDEAAQFFRENVHCAPHYMVEAVQGFVWFGIYLYYFLFRLICLFFFQH